MAISRIKTSSVLQGFPKSRSLLAGNPYFQPTSFESIATVTVGSGGSANVEFTSIPSTYTHLQVRGIMRISAADQNQYGVYAQFNSDTATNYSWHLLQGTGSAASATGNASQAQALVGTSLGNNHTSGIFGAMVLDILDYKDTNKYKTTRSLTGDDTNGTGTEMGLIYFASGNWRSTSAINSIKIFASQNLAQYSTFALYGIKAGA